MTRIYTAELTAYDPSLGGTRTLYLCSGTGFVTRPSDSPSNVTFEPAIIQPALVRSDAFQYGTTSGRSQIGLGDLILNNANGSLDALVDYGLDGRSIVLRVGDDTQAYPSGFTTILTSVMEFVEVGVKTVVVRVRDRQFLVKKEFNATRFAGNSPLPFGLEGVAEDLKGLPKPRLYGQVSNITPPIVNTSRLIYQVNDGAVSDVTDVFDRGAALTKGADYTSQSDMETNAPVSGSFRVWKAGGYFRLGAAPSGAITANCVQGANGTERTAAFIAKAILTGPGGLSLGDLDTASFTALDVANSSVVGIFVNEEAEVPEVMDLIVSSVGAFWGVGKDGRFRVKRIEAPSGSPVIDFTGDNILQLTRGATADDARGIPPYSTVVFYAKNYTVQVNDVAGSVTSARRSEIGLEWKQAVSIDPVIQTKHLLSPALGFPSYMISEASAQAEADRLLALYGVRRDLVNLDVALDPTFAGLLDLGIVTRLTYPRYGFNAGKLFLVIGYALDSRRNRAIVTLWG